jgi:hypothetical protein
MVAGAAPDGEDLVANPTITPPTITTDKAMAANVSCDIGRVP